MLESDIERQVVERAKANGWLVYKWKSEHNRGVPDRIMFRNGETIAIEFKAPGKKPSKIQLRQHEKLEKQGIAVFVVDSLIDGYVIAT